VSRLQAAVAAAGVMICTSAAVFSAVDPVAAVAPRLEFTPPRPGTYVLQKIQPIANATLLDAKGRPTQLSAATTGRITLLTFFYTYCADPLGCPFAYHTLMQVRRGVLEDSRLARHVRFLSVSLDPTTDTPEVVGRYKDMVMRDSTLEWNVLTARSVRDLLPVLDDFGQDVSVEQAPDGTARRTLHHMLKMFLIDRTGTVREIYTLAYLQPEVILDDIQTLYLEEKPKP
jgi:cytochrome oxidase Cu insertion factor (SCO1/SenC/PrrC family)